jgi:hypothetical protein
VDPRFAGPESRREPEPGAVPDPPPDPALPAERRTWIVLALLNLVALFASIPYENALLSQGPFARQVSPAFRLGVELALLVGITWPAIALGLRLGKGLGLGAPWIAGAFRGAQRERPARATFGLAAGAGLLTGVVLLVAGGTLESAFHADFAPLSGFAPPTPWAGLLGAFGAGIAEETWLRLIVMTVLVALGQVLLHPNRDPVLPGRLPSAGILWTANVLAALVFGGLHFGNLHALGAPVTPVLASYILLFNGIVGLLCGWLYWTRGLEAAIVYHIAVDVILHAIAPAFGGIS